MGVYSLRPFSEKEDVNVKKKQLGYAAIAIVVLAFVFIQQALISPRALPGHPRLSPVAPAPRGAAIPMSRLTLPNLSRTPPLSSSPRPPSAASTHSTSATPSTRSRRGPSSAPTRAPSPSRGWTYGRTPTPSSTLPTSPPPTSCRRSSRRARCSRPRGAVSLRPSTARGGRVVNSFVPDS